VKVAKNLPFPGLRLTSDSPGRDVLRFWNPDDDDRQAAAKRPSESSTLNRIGSSQIVALVSDSL